MAVREIVKLPSPVLRQVSEPVAEVTDDVRHIMDDMLDTMYDAPGVGLAANQVGLQLSCFVYDDHDGRTGFIANPELDAFDGEQTESEGCLSIPGPYADTSRAMHVRLRGVDLQGRPVEIEGDDLLARIFQHETDHLNGKLYIDHLDDDGRRDVMRQLREIELSRDLPG